MNCLAYSLIFLTYPQAKGLGYTYSRLVTTKLWFIVLPIFAIISLALLKYRQYFCMLQTLKLYNEKQKNLCFAKKKFGRLTPDLNKSNDKIGQRPFYTFTHKNILRDIAEQFYLMSFCTLLKVYTCENNLLIGHTDNSWVQRWDKQNTK